MAQKLKSGLVKLSPAELATQDSNIRTKVQSGDYKHHSSKCTEEEGVIFMLKVLDFVIQNPTVTSWKKFYEVYTEPFTFGRMGAISTLSVRFPSCRLIADEIIEIERDRIVEKSLSNEVNGSFAKYLLSVNYGMRETTQIEVSSKEVRFHWDNPELQDIKQVE